MLSYSSKVVASYGNNNEIENAPKTVTQIEANIQKSGSCIIVYSLIFKNGLLSPITEK
jgi:hypothetical protein